MNIHENMTRQRIGLLKKHQNFADHGFVTNPGVSQRTETAIKGTRIKICE